MATINKLNEKSEVLNPLTLFHTIGQELENIFNIHQKDVSLMEIPDLRNKEKLTKSQIRKACEILDIEDFFIEFLESFQKEYAQKKIECKKKFEETKHSYRKLKSVIPLLKNEFNDGYDILDDIFDFFGANSEEEIKNIIKETGILYRDQNQTLVDEINLSAWIRRGELDYRKTGNIPIYDKSKLKEWIEEKKWDAQLESVHYFESLPQILHNFGVCLVLIPYMPKTIYGAVKWIDGHPIIMISDREQDLATCWFTLFHELGHVLLHENELSMDGMINGGESKGQMTQREKDANKFANSYLFNGDDLRKHVFELKRMNIYECQGALAKRFDVKPIFVGYWMRKAQYYPNQHYKISITFS